MASCSNDLYDRIANGLIPPYIPPVIPEEPLTQCEQNLYDDMKESILGAETIYCISTSSSSGLTGDEVTINVEPFDPDYITGNKQLDISYSNINGPSSFTYIASGPLVQSFTVILDYPDVLGNGHITVGGDSCQTLAIAITVPVFDRPPVEFPIDRVKNIYGATVVGDKLHVLARVDYLYDGPNQYDLVYRTYNITKRIDGNIIDVDQEYDQQVRWQSSVTNVVSFGQLGNSSNGDLVMSIIYGTHSLVHYKINKDTLEIENISYQQNQDQNTNYMPSFYTDDDVYTGRDIPCTYPVGVKGTNAIANNIYTNNAHIFTEGLGGLSNTAFKQREEPTWIEGKLAGNRFGLIYDIDEQDGYKSYNDPTIPLECRGFPYCDYDVLTNRVAARIVPTSQNFITCASTYDKHVYIDKDTLKITECRELPQGEIELNIAGDYILTEKRDSPGDVYVKYIGYRDRVSI